MQLKEQTYWNGEPCKATKVNVVVGKSERPTWWCANLEGQKRKAVMVEFYGEKFYLDDEDGSGWLKITKGMGSPTWGHKSLPDSSTVLNDANERIGTTVCEHGVPTDARCSICWPYDEE